MTEPTTRLVTDDGADPGPGRRLREAREAAELSVAEVASRLRLDERIIQLLEHDQYDELHGPTFVRGYLGGYARLLDLPERPIMEAYERRGSGPPALVADIARKPQVRVSDFPVRMVTYLIAGLLAVLVVLWWQSRQPPIISGGESVATMGLGDDATAAATIGNAGSVAEAGSGSGQPTAPPTNEVGSHAPSDQETADVASAGIAFSQPAADSPSSSSDGSNTVGAPEAPPGSVQSSLPEGPSIGQEQEPAGDALASASPPEESAPVVPARDSTSAAPSELPLDDTTVASSTPSELSASDAPGTVLSQSDEPPPIVAAAGAEAAPPEPPPLPGSDVLRMQFSRQSWVEVYDRYGGRLYYSLAPEGSEILVRGAGPMEVLLGDVEGASVAYNGKPHDMTSYRGRSVVRFTVGEGTISTTPSSPSAPAGQEPPILEQPAGSDPAVPEPSPAPEPFPPAAPDLQATGDPSPALTSSARDEASVRGMPALPRLSTADS